MSLIFERLKGNLLTVGTVELTPDILELSLTAVTAIVGIASIIIAVLTLRQNNKMIESSTRPVVKVYLTQTYIQAVHHYLILKNFGASSATITKFEFDCDFDLSKISYEDVGKPFSHIVGTELAPSQSIHTSLAVIQSKLHISEWHKNNEQPLTFTIHVEYLSESGKKYSDKSLINLSYDQGLTYVRPSVNDQQKTLQYIMHSLVALVEKLL